MVQQGFFSGSASRDKRIAGGFSGYSTEDKKNVINYQKKKAADPSYKPKSYELDSLKKQTMPGRGLAFSPRLDDVKVAENKVAQPLSEPGSEAFNEEIKQYEKSIRRDLDFDMIDRYGVDELKNLTEEGKQRLEDSYKIYRQYNYDRNPLQYQPGIDFSEKRK